MLDRLFGSKTHDFLQFLGFFTLAVGLPMNKVVMSIGTILLAANLILKGDFNSYWKRWKGSVVFWFILLVFVLHIIGLLYTQDFAYSLNDLNAKLPFFIIPTALIAYPVSQKQIHYILYGFLLSLFITSAINFNYILSHKGGDYRDYSLFGSHIRYALLIVTGILVSLYFSFKHKAFWVAYLPLILWFAYYTLISRVFNGYLSIPFVLLALILYFIGKIPQRSKQNIAFTLLTGFMIVCGLLLYQNLKPHEKLDGFAHFPTHSKSGEVYQNDTTNLWLENGHPVLSLIAPLELEKAWNERSNIKFYDVLGNEFRVRDILVRYMASKGLTKDKEGMEQMTDWDIHNVENGTATILDTYSPLKRNWLSLKNEVKQYTVGGNPNGNSLLQRLEHWKAAKEIIKANWIFGVGTGDVQKAFNDEYARSDSRLDMDNRKRAHNQYMTFWIAFGIVGFLVFTIFWFWYLAKNIQVGSLIGIGFTLIAMVSFLSEDTIETQQGVTFIALFLGISELIRSKGVTSSK